MSIWDICIRRPVFTTMLVLGPVVLGMASYQRLGVELFVNARTDVYLKNLVPAERRLEETLARAGGYRAAGADGIFVPGVTDPSEIRTIASEVGLPLNVLARAGLPPASELARLGVRRLSAGSGIAFEDRGTHALKGIPGEWQLFAVAA